MTTSSICTGTSLSGGRYEITEKLGVGGMATVYLAHDNNLNVAVAIKFPDPNLLRNSDFRDRFLQETRSLVSLRHPNILKIIDVGQQDGTPYAVMDYLSGGSVNDQRYQDNQGNYLPVVPVFFDKWLNRIADALDFIHRKGFVHRDIKPDNILFDDHGNAFLSDFGIAKVYEETKTTGHTNLTRTGMLIGTPEYMAPEISLGQKYDGRSDQYSLAVLVYELLVGSRPFIGATPAALVMKQMQKEFHQLSELQRRWGQSVTNALTRALATDPGARFASCCEFEGELARAFANTPDRHIEEPVVSKCPTCSAAIAIQPEWIGRIAHCNKCRERIQIQATGMVVPASAVSALPQQTAGPIPVTNQDPVGPRCPGCDTVLRIAANLRGKKGKCSACEMLLQISQDGRDCVAATNACLTPTLNIQSSGPFTDTSEQDLASTSLTFIRPLRKRATARAFKAKSRRVAIAVGIAAMLGFGVWFFRGSDWASRIAAIASIKVRLAAAESVTEATASPESVSILTGPKTQGDLPSEIVSEMANQSAATGLGEADASAQGIKSTNAGAESVIKAPGREASPATAGNYLSGTANKASVLETSEQFQAAKTALTKARQVLASAKWDQMNAAAEAAVRAAATPEQKQMAEQLVQLAELATYYHVGVEKAIDGLKAAESFNVTEQLQVSIVEITAEKVVLRFNGRNKDYARTELPLLIAHKIAGFTLPIDSPATKAAAQAYQALAPVTTPQNREQAVKSLEAMPPQSDGVDPAGLVAAIRQVFPTAASQASSSSSARIPIGEAIERIPSQSPPIPITPFSENEAKAHQTVWATYLDQPAWFTNSIGMKLILIPPGTFMMGSPPSEAGREDNETQHRVTLTKDFYLGTTEVTQTQWEAVMGTTPWRGKAQVREGPNFAATYVSWDDAVEFCQKISSSEGKAYRLPTEAEWESACRAGTSTAYSFGEDAEQLSEYGWCGANAGGISPGGRYAHAVALRRPNAFGLYDMHGNVAEWCSDWYSTYPTGSAKDPQGALSGSLRMIRGGGFDGWNYHAKHYRSASRFPVVPASSKADFGFRLALSSVEPGDISVRPAAALQALSPIKASITTGERISPEIPTIPIAPFSESQAKAHQAAWATYLDQPVLLTNSIGMKLKLIPPGTFMMGSPPSEAGRINNETQHRVTLTEPYFLGTTEVTQGQWKSVMGTTPWKGKPEVKEGINVAATFVNWGDAVEFCRRLSGKEGETYRLPTETEWEHACRGGSTTAYGFGSYASELNQYGWWGRVKGSAYNVGLKRFNAYGLYDMHGNVWEWCSDRYVADYRVSPMSDLTGSSAGVHRVFRGGSWHNSAADCRSAHRGEHANTLRTASIGFRVALRRATDLTNATAPKTN